MIKSISRKMKYLLVAVFAFVFSFTALIVSMPKAHAAGEDTTTLEPDASENYTLPYSKSSRMFMGNYSSHQAETGSDDESNYGLRWEWSGWATDGNNFLLKANTTYTLTVTDMSGTSVEGVKYAIYGRIYLGTKTGGTINNVYCTIQREGQALQSATMSGSRIVEWFPDLYGTGSRVTYTITNNDSSDLVLYYAYFDLIWGDGKTIVLDYNDKEYGSTKSETFVHFYYAYSGVTVPKRDGYKFLGFYDQKEGGTQFYKADGNPARQKFDLNQDDSTKTLYAHWELAENTITLNKNGGTGGSNSVVATQGKAMPTSGVTMPTRVGYDFMGYYDTSASTGGKQYYTSTGASASNWDKTVDTILYARWQLKSEIQNVINKINAIGTVSYPGSKTKINTARSAYNALSSDYQKLVSNYNTLTTAESTYETLRANAISNTINLIDAIGEVTYPDSKASIVAAENAYSSLDSSDRSAVTNYGTLTAARDEYDSQGEEKVNEVIAAINAIDPEIAYPKSEVELDNANTLYNALDSLEKPEVTNYETLVGYNTTYATLREAAVNNVIALIDAISNPFDLDDYQLQIKDARTDFDNLGNNDKNEGAVTNLQKLLDAEAATIVVVQIQNIGEAFDNDEYRNKASDAYDAYMALTNNQKAMVPDSILDILMDDREIVNVMDAINAIGDVEFTGESKALIDAANTAYEALDDDLKDDVANYGKLVQANTDYDNVFDVVGMINAIPEFEYTPEFKEIIDNDRNAYDALTPYQKSIIPEEILAKVLDAEAKYNAIDNIVNIGEIKNTKESINKVIKAKEAYDALDNAQKECVSEENLTLLNNAVAVVDVLDKINEVKNAGYTQKDKDNIDATRTAYNALTNDQKEIFPADAVVLLTNIEAVYPLMVTINQLGKVEYTDDFKAKLESAKATYDALPNDQKKLVRNYVVLSVDIQSYNKVDNVYKAIENINKVKYNNASKETIEEARKQYNKLSDDEKELITNSDELIQAEKKYEKAEHNHNVGMAWLAGILITVGVVIVATGLWLLIILILKRRKEKEDEENKKNKKNSKKTKK